MKGLNFHGLIRSNGQANILPSMPKCPSSCRFCMAERQWKI